MTITALDITQRQFKRALRGYEADEVQSFLHEVAGAFEAQARELQSLRDQLSRRDDEIESWKGRERMLQETLLTAQKACDDIREAARREADAMVADAELQAEKIVQGAHARFLRIVDDINELKRQRVQFETNVRTLAESHLKLIEALRDPAREEAVQYVPVRKRAGEE